MRGDEKTSLNRKEKNMSIRLKPEFVSYPQFMFFVIYNKNTRTWHVGGMKEFVGSKHISGAKMYQSCDYAEKVVKNICGEDINSFAIIRYIAVAKEVVPLEGSSPKSI